MPGIWVLHHSLIIASWCTHLEINKLFNMSAAPPRKDVRRCDVKQKVDLIKDTCVNQSPRRSFWVINMVLEPVLCLRYWRRPIHTCTLNNMRTMLVLIRNDLTMCASLTKWTHWYGSGCRKLENGNAGRTRTLCPHGGPVIPNPY